MGNKKVAVKPRPVSGPWNDKTLQIERYRLLVESVQDYAIFLLDPDGCVASWNAGARRFKGYREDEIIGKHFSTFYTAEDIKNDKPAKKLAEARKNGRAEDEGWRVRKDGSKFWANAVITSLYDEEGTLRGFAKVTRDLTERKAMEDQLEQVNRELRKRQAELTLLNEAKDEFILLASHQLRTPATGVKQYLNLILEGFLGEIPERIRHAIQKANNSNERQIELIEDLLQVARLDAGKIVLRRANTNLTQLVRDVVAEQHDNFQERKQHVSFSSKSNQLTANVDSSRLRMVFENLVDNASKYTPEEGRVNIKVSASGDEAVVAVKDTGVGIKEENLVQLFQKFSRIKNSLSDKVSGSGLGLYWAHKVVELHGGRIDVRSQLGEGSEFVVVLPRGQRDA